MRQPLVVDRLGAHWGSAVAKRRASLGMTQAQLAELCDVSQQTISKIEKGLIIPLDRLKVVIAQKLGTSPDQLFVWPSPEKLAEAAS